MYVQGWPVAGFGAAGPRLRLRAQDHPRTRASTWEGTRTMYPGMQNGVSSASGACQSSTAVVRGAASSGSVSAVPPAIAKPGVP